MSKQNLCLLQDLLYSVQSLLHMATMSIGYFLAAFPLFLAWSHLLDTTFSQTKSLYFLSVSFCVPAQHNWCTYLKEVVKISQTLWF